jgi:hypothetical protein
MWVDGTLKVNDGFEKGKFDAKAVEAVVGKTKSILE